MLSKKLKTAYCLLVAVDSKKSKIAIANVLVLMRKRKTNRTSLLMYNTGSLFLLKKVYHPAFLASLRSLL